VFYAAPTRQSWGQYLESAPKGWSGKVRDPKQSWCTKGDVNVDKVALSSKALATGEELGSGLAMSYRGAGKSDWYLPSIKELQELIAHQGATTGLISDFYWSSSQYEFPTSAFGQDASSGESGYGLKKLKAVVRPIRAF